jgi:hypothetical protein
MITTIIVLLITLLLSAVSFALGLVTFVLPDQFTEAITYFVSYLSYADFLIPIDTLLQATGIYVTFIFALYSVKILMWVFRHLPFFKHHESPTLHHEQTSRPETRPPSMGRSMLLRSKRKIGMGQTISQRYKRR